MMVWGCLALFRVSDFNTVKETLKKQSYCDILQFLSGVARVGQRFISQQDNDLNNN